jgi:glucokinase
MGSPDLNPVYLGLESGGTKLCASLCDDGEQSIGFLSRVRPSGASASDTVEALASLGRAALAAHAQGAAPAAIGWGFGGPVDRAANRPLVNFHEPGWEGIDAVAGLSRELGGAPLWVENDCKVAALAEAHHGAGSPTGLTAYITLGSGIGGGLVWNGEILASGPRGEMEVGHVEIVPGGALCACGRRGCLEAYCSAWGLGERALERAASRSNPGPVARAVLSCEPRERARVLLEGGVADPFAREMAGDFVSHLAPFLARLIQTLAPARLVLGGGLSGSTWLVEAVSAAVSVLLPDTFRGSTSIVPARLGPAAVSFGAALHAKRRARA